MSKQAIQKFISVFTAVLILFACAISVFAADPFRLTEEASAKDGKVYVTIMLPGTTDLGTISFTLSYDSSLLEYVSADYASGDVTSTNANELGKVGINAVWNDTAPNGNELVTVTFNIKDGASGETSFPLSVNYATNASDEDVDVLAITGKVDLTGALASSETTSAGSADEVSVAAGNIPKTYGQKIALGAAGVAVVAAAVVTGVAIKRKSGKQ